MYVAPSGMIWQFGSFFKVKQGEKLVLQQFKAISWVMDDKTHHNLRRQYLQLVLAELSRN